MAYLFPLKGELENNLKCHEDDCGMNVLNYLGIIPRKKALYIADTTDAIYAERIEDFLTDTYGVKFRQEQMWNIKDAEKEDDGRKMIELYNLNVIIPEKKGVIIFIYKKGVGHFAVIGKIDDELYFINPQSGGKYLLFGKEIEDYIISSKFEKVFVYVSDGNATRHKPNIEEFHNKLLKDRNYLQLLDAVGTPHFNMKLKHAAKGIIMHHGQLIKGKKYQIIDKITEQSIDIGIFDKKIEGASFIIKHNDIPDEEFYVTTDDNTFIRIKESLDNATNEPFTKLIKGQKYRIIDKKTDTQINTGIFDKMLEGASFIIKHIGKPNEEFGVSIDDNKFIRIKESLGSAPAKGTSRRNRSRSKGNKSRKSRKKAKSI